MIVQPQCQHPKKASAGGGPSIGAVSRVALGDGGWMDELVGSSLPLPLASFRIAFASLSHRLRIGFGMRVASSSLCVSHAGRIVFAVRAVRVLLASVDVPAFM